MGKAMRPIALITLIFAVFLGDTSGAAAQMLGYEIGGFISGSISRSFGTMSPNWRGRRVALVIGNSNYINVSPLRNPRHDAHAIADALQRSGFAQVTQRHDLQTGAMIEEIESFSRLAKGADWAVVYYAGHGIEINGVNYLLPVEFDLSTGDDIARKAVPLARLLDKVGVARRLNLVILDACRNNPFADMVASAERDRPPSKNRARAATQGLADVTPPAGILLAYASKHGTVALDGSGNNSPYAQALVDHVMQPGLEIGDLFRKVRDKLHTVTKGEQVPYTYGSLPRDPFYFN